ncbi:MAG: hypothetical protein K2K90_01760 [Lachnospiraceae bacterium]|nr:hypothetical protein [Lachnospiraceae bacterium]
METLAYLRKFRKEIKIIDEINEQIKTSVPDNWILVFATTDMQERISKILNIWRDHISSKLPNTFSYLEQNVKTLDLISYDGKFSVLYGIQMGTGEINYFEGGNPLDCQPNDLLTRMPKELKKFYLSVHNGFYFFPIRSMGILPLEKVTCFAQSEWGIIEDLEEPLQINLDTTYGFYNNAAGVYIAIDYENCDNDNATIWYTDYEPYYNINFWKEVDEWMREAFE